MHFVELYKPKEFFARLHMCSIIDVLLLTTKTDLLSVDLLASRQRRHFLKLVL